MSNTSDSDFIREVDEAVRQEALKKAWDRYGMIVLLGAFLIVAGVAGYKGWTYWKHKQASETGARFTGAMTLVEEGNEADAMAAFKELAADGPAGYRLLSRFQIAALTAKGGKVDEAIRIYDEIAASGAGGQPLLGDVARIRAAMLLTDTASLEEMKRRIGSLAEGDHPLRNSARELLGLTAYRLANMEEAEKYFTAALVDPGIPQTMRQRIEKVLALVVKADEAPAKGKS
ncbi:MAG: hypothetical protein Kow0032_15890 [Methyloligellaceae bacterium]